MLGELGATMARSSTSFKPGNDAAWLHGLRAQSRARAGRRLRAKYRAELLADRSWLSPTELRLGVDINVHAYNLRGWIDSMDNPRSQQGLAAANALDRLMGRWERWCQRAVAAQPAPDDPWSRLMDP